ncbi:MAG: hypothetical protein LUG66_06995 [Clostridiales bacterium]|nr:hypothetical protein [Clostridiales bacterium]
MTKKEYLKEIGKCKISTERVRKLEDIYEYKICETIKQIISYSDKSVFFDDGSRILSFSEIAEAENDLHVDFIKLKIIPVVDCGENDFIVYHFDSNSWSLFNIIDECTFKERASIDKLLIKE